MTLSPSERALRRQRSQTRVATERRSVIPGRVDDWETALWDRRPVSGVCGTDLFRYTQLHDLAGAIPGLHIERIKL